jgi:hypothetical protein
VVRQSAADGYALREMACSGSCKYSGTLREQHSKRAWTTRDEEEGGDV